MMTESPLLIGHRYQLYEQLGAGGMGAVYRAADRLTGQNVALKRVLAQLASAQDTPANEAEDLRVGLSSEFRTLASLRHPHIIAVSDYGFDAERQPYFTMDLLEQPRTLTDAGCEDTLPEKVRLLVETLYALAYLHRRGIVHRDLKPANVLVDKQGTVKVLDFGLSLGKGVLTVTNLQTEAAGTLAYMAPEVFKEEAITPAADLFAFGIMAYELFAGHYPYNNKNVALLVNSLLSTEPDYDGLDTSLAGVLRKLLAKTPAERFQSAEAVIAALCDATGQSMPEESAAVRESYLQASQFVGREAELALLKDALAQASAGRGSAWLVGGESGVGKSRLLDELRIRASVRGALVLRGQGVAEGGLPYQLWRDPVRRLVLSSDLTDIEASILKEIVPDIDVLLRRAVPDAPELDGRAQQQQLSLTIADLFKRQRQPVLLLLEDLQWAAESLEPLKQLNWLAAGLPLLIVSSYRDDERPDLPQELLVMRTMRLGRLSREAIVELSASMLGDAGRQPEIVELLQRETEGNAFFMAEVVRALAGEAGRLTEVGRARLPETVFTGELRRVMQRRLQRVPPDALELLKLAAVAGRLLDFRILHRVAPPIALNLDDWLTICANTAVLEVIDGQWRFSHDKIREALLADLTEAERPILHRRVGEALEAEYPNHKPLAAVLVEHWHTAGDVDKVVHYTLLAVEQMLNVSAFREAQTLIERGLSVLNGRSDADAKLARMLKLLGDTFSSLGNYEQADAHYDQSLALAQTLADAALEADTMVSRASMLEQQGNLAEAARYATQSLALYRQLEDRQGTALSLEILGHVTYGQDNYPSARDYYEKSLALYQEGSNQWGIAKSLNNLGNVLFRHGEHVAARDYYERSLALCYQMGNRRGIAIRLNNLGNLAYMGRDAASARDYFEKSLALCNEIGDRQGIADTSTTLGDVCLLVGDLAGARSNYERSLALCRELGHLGDTAVNLRNLGWLSAVEGDDTAAHAYCAQSLAASVELDSPVNVLAAMVGYARVYLSSRPERSAELVGLIEAHAVTDLEIREFRLKPLLVELKQTLSETALAAALERGKALGVNIVAQELLKDTSAG
jgi:tetratricopeptide (TPR) repeat protein